MGNPRAVKVFRQGDVLVFSSTIPADAADTTPKDERIVLAYGEVTGHAHAIAPGSGVAVKERGPRKWLDVTAPAPLAHEEHDTIVLPSGQYEVIIQVEYTPDALRRVED